MSLRSAAEDLPPTHGSDDPHGKRLSPDNIRNWLISQVAKKVGVDDQKIDVKRPLAQYGLDSGAAVTLSSDLTDLLGREVAPTIVWDYPTIDAIANHLAGPQEREVQADPAARTRDYEREPIAVVGIGCRFPGGVTSPAEFWSLLRDGVDAIREIPAERWDVERFYDPGPAVPGKMNTRWGGFLDRPDMFDARFFDISPREATRMDPQQRILMEVAWEALEDAGQVPEKLAGSRTAVFVGICGSEYGLRQLSDINDIDVYAVTGNAMSIAANRLSYFFDFRGPSVALDTACSSSLVAIDGACRSIWDGQTDQALAGGANLILSPAITINFSQALATSPDGRCKAFDARANGMVRSEGVALVFLKPLSRALADRDSIYALIRGGTVNQDGRTNGIAAPSQWAQAAVLREAYANAGVSPGQIEYVDAHGTGTLLGDPIEAGALGSVLAEGRALGQTCAIGSVKSNLGHLEAAAGVASLIKVALSLKYRLIPPSLHFEKPNPHIPFEKLPIRVQRELGAWPEHSGSALAGVSAFGFGGTNAHLVLEEAPRDLPSTEEAEAEDRPYLLPLSARSPLAVRDLVRAYKEYFEVSKGDGPWLRDVCYTAGVRRTHHSHRVSFVARSRKAFIERFQSYLDVTFDNHVPHESEKTSPKVAFVYPGQGAMTAGVGRRLLASQPAFRDAFLECDRLIRAVKGFSVADELSCEPKVSRLRAERTDLTQAALLAFQLGLTAMWRAWGVEAEAVIGHSVGEAAAAAAAGVLSLPEAVRVVCARGELMQGALAESEPGAMAAVRLTWEKAEAATAAAGGQVGVAVHNAEGTVVLSGQREALTALVAQLQESGVAAQMLPVPGAGHSPLMGSLARTLVAQLDGLQPRPSPLAVYSTVAGQLLGGEEFGAAYWGRNLRQTVLFAEAAAAMVTDGYDCFVEMCAAPQLTASVWRALRGQRRRGFAVEAVGRGGGCDEEEEALEALGSVYGRGAVVRWEEVSGQGQMVRLPAYPWQRQRFWFQEEGLGYTPSRQGSDTDARRQATPHPLIGSHLQSSVDPDTYFWEAKLDIKSLPFLKDHRTQDVVLLPASFYVELALSAGTDLFGPWSHVIEDVVFERTLALPEGVSPRIQLVMNVETPGRATFRFFSLTTPLAPENARPEWELHATGALIVGSADSTELPASDPSQREAAQARCVETIDVAEFYRGLRSRGGNYGPSFQNVREIRRIDGEALGKLQMGETTARESASYQLHPALLDSCFQVLAATIPRGGQLAPGDGYVPVGLRSFQLFERPRPFDELWAHAILRPSAARDADTLEGDISVLDDSGKLLISANGLHIKRVNMDAKPDVSKWFYRVHWEAQPSLVNGQQGVEEPSEAPARTWVIFSDRKGVGQGLAASLEARGETCIVVLPGEDYVCASSRQYQLDPSRPEDFRQLFQDSLGETQSACRGLVYLWGLEMRAAAERLPSSFDEDQRLGCIGALHLVQAAGRMNWKEAPRLWLVTAGANTVSDDSGPIAIEQCPLWGLGKTVAFEHPELHCTNIDLSPAADGQGVEAGALIEELWRNREEQQVALRDGARYVARLVRCATDEKDTGSQLAAHSDRVISLPTDPAADQSFLLEVATPGILDSLIWREATRRRPGPGEVEIQVHAIGLNFRDVLKTIGVYPVESARNSMLGDECAGIIVALGAGVEGMNVGDEVVAVTSTCFGGFVTCPFEFVTAKPLNINFEQAATIPIAFMTAHYALHDLGKLSRGERVLIHAASGGVGLAAVQVAQWKGAEVYATAGTEEKREILRSLGIKYVMNSRKLTFAKEIMDFTGNDGVDVVLNSLSGESIEKSLSVLRSYGRFLEIGQRDIYQNSRIGLRPFKNDLSFHAVGLERMFVEKPARATALLREVVRHVTEGTFTPLPHRRYAAREAASAFRYMARAKHTGKLVVSFRDGEDLAVSPRPTAPASCRSDGTYLITGGLGGLGLTFARWMVRRGARHLVLMGRRAPSAAANTTLDALKAAGALVSVAQVDVTVPEQLLRLLEEIRESPYPLRGVIHMAGHLDDGLLLNLSESSFRSVFAPKVKGAMLLHRLTATDPLDFFVMFSSAASLLGSPGQANYAAANAFLDGLAHHRRASGRPGLSINWGPWADVGGAALLDQVERLAFRGIGSISPDRGLEAFERLLGSNAAQVGVMPLNLRQWSQFYPKASASSLIAHLLRDQGGTSGTSEETGQESPFRKLLAVSAPELRKPLLVSHLQEQVAKVVGLRPAEVSPHTTLGNLGLDSLMSLELRNRLEASLGLTLSPTTIWNYPTIAALVPYIAARAGLPIEPAPPVAPDEETDAQAALSASLEQLSAGEIASLLAEELGAFKEGNTE